MVLAKNVAKSIGNIISDTNSEIVRLLATVSGNGFINSPTIHDNPKYMGRKIAMVVSVQKIIGLA
ncbi:MAG: hypothetical protein WCG25_06375 [bacterium]